MLKEDLYELKKQQEPRLKIPPQENPEREREILRNGKRTVLKKAVNSGKELTYTVKKIGGASITKKVKQREMKPPFSNKCGLNCSESFSNDERLQIFNDFYESGDKSKQSQQLASLVTQLPAQRQRKKDKLTSRNREFRREYTFIKNGIPIKVLSVMFLNTLAIDEKRV